MFNTAVLPSLKEEDLLAACKLKGSGKTDMCYCY